MAIWETHYAKQTNEYRSFKRRMRELDAKRQQMMMRR